MYPNAPTPPQQQPTTFTPNATSGNRQVLLVGLIVVFALGAIGFGVAAIWAFGQANTAKSTLNQQKQAAADAAKAEQKAADEQAAIAAAESPFRSYKAPDEFGSFEIKFPKDWSASADEERSGSTQVALTLNPNFFHRANNVDDLVAAKVTLQQKTSDEFLKPYNNAKGITHTTVTVSGIASVQLAGSTFPDKRTSRMVVVPVRDKVIVFTNEASKYSHEFDQILAQSKIVP